ncbi:MAG TPA: sodium:proton antiporter [Rubrobacteraceae bacterium]|nr:sodium:proton antiporter [Rubrobacteraceae bacterium]
MEVEQILRDLGLILAAGLASRLIASVLRIPEMILLVTAGALLGPSVLGLVSNPLDGVGSQLLFNIGVALILFHGGVGISLRVISRTAVGLGLLVLPGVMITTIVVAVVVAPIFGVPFPVALMIGAVLSATDPAILIPLFEQLNLRPKVSQTVIAESAFNDPVGTVLTLALVGAVQSGKFSFGGPALEFAQEMVLGTVIGVAAGLILAYLVASSARLGIWDEAPGVAILAVVALAYFSNEALQGSGYLAAFVMGLIVGNMHEIRLGQSDEHARLLEGFVAQISDIATVLVFVTLGLNLPFDSLGKYFFGGLVVIAVFIFVARPVTVLACLLPDRRGRWTRNEIAFLGWCRYTGVVPAAVASLLLAQGVPGAELAVSLVALAVLATLLLQATTAGVVAKRLGLIEDREPGPAG